MSSAGPSGTADEVSAALRSVLAAEGAPAVLWQCAFTQQCREVASASALPAGVLVTRHLAHDGPSFTPLVERARSMFELLCPGLPFLPPLPDPEVLPIAAAAADEEHTAAVEAAPTSAATPHEPSAST